MKQILSNEQIKRLGKYVGACVEELEMLSFVGKLEDDDFQLSAEEIEDVVCFFELLDRGE